MEPRNPFPKQQRHRHARWAWVGILFRLLLSLVLLLQSAGIGQAAPVAVPGEAPLATAAMQEPPAAEGLFADVESSPPDIAAEPVAEALPVPLMLRLETDRYLLTPGERAELTLHAWRATGASLAGLPLTLALPAPLVAAAEEQTRWALPELGEQEIFTRTVTVALRRAFTQSTAVVDVTLQSPPWQAPWLAASEATTETLHFAAQQVTLRLGLDATAAVPAAAVQAAGVTTAELREQGLVLQGSQGDVTLLVPVGSARQRSRFTYSDGYRWGGQPSTTQPSTSMTPTITTTQPNRIFLPLVSGGGEMAIAASDGITEEAFLVEDGVAFVRRWSLAATEAGRERTSFDERLQLVVDVSWLVALGFDPERLTLYTREHREQPWEEVPSSRYEAAHERFVAQTSHFSEYGLGLHNGVVGELLPDVGAFGTELFTGAATVNYPIEVPAGAGGMAPALSLNYSTATVDSQRWENKQNQANGYRIQAGIAGLGWSLSAMNHIAFIDEGSDRFSPHDNRYSLVLNGTSTTFLDGQTLSESFARIERNLQTVTARGRKVVHTGEWTVTTRDGTRHLFGGAAISPVTAAQDANQSVMLHNIGSYHTYRVVNKWYLRKSVDSHGNWVEYNYRSFYRNTHCSTNNRYRPGWYYHSIRPASIYWGGNEQTGAGHKLRVLFGYEGRSDTGIYRRTNPCTQSIYSNERLRTIRVEVHANGAWRPLREYELGYIYTAGYYRHSWLNQIRQYGYTHRGNAPPIRTSTPLHTYSFDYTIGAIHSEVYLLNANNGWGGRVSYRYSAPATWRCEIDRRVNCDPVAYRRQVVNRYVYDGAYPTANWVRTQYGYGEGLYRRYKNDPVEFLGYPSASVVTYKRNDYRNEAKVTEHWFYRNNGYRDRDDIANNPDPRLGHTDLEKIWQPGTSGCPRANQHHGRCLMAYTNYSYRALTGSGNNWNSTNSYSVRPRWVRQEQVVQWVDGAEKTQRFFYEPSKQNNQQFGNVTRVEEWAGGVQQRATETYYYPNRGAHLVNLPARVRVLDGAGRCVAEQRTTYDGNGGNYNRAPTKGNPSRRQRALTGCTGSSWIGDNDSGWQITLLSHDRYGNVTREMHFGTPVQSIETEYDASYHRFPVRRWSGGHQETARYYGVNGLAVTDGRAHWGQLAEWCGVNAICTRTSYDSFGRPLRQWNGVAAGAAWNQSPASAAVHYGYYARGYGGSHTNFVVAWHAPRCYGNFVRSHYNGLGQLVQEQRPRQEWRTNIDGCNPGSYAPEVDVNYSYDALGNRIWRSVPVATGGRAINRVANWSAGYSRTEYDVLGRVSRTHAPNGERHDYDYVGRALSVVNVGLGNDGKRLVKWTQTDALGNLRSVRSYNPNGSGWQLAGQVMLTHDLLGNLTQVRHPNGIGSTTLHYDLGGRKTSMDDPDLGRWHYAHDRQGRLTRQTDARGKTTCLYYDGYGRLRGKHFRTNTSCPGSVSSYDVRYTYDQHHGSANRSRGQLTQVYYQRSGGYYKNLYYNSQGLLVREQVRIPGQGLLNSWYGYDRYQRPTTLTYPDGEVVTTWYNSMGLPAKLHSNRLGNLVDGEVDVSTVDGAMGYVEYDAAGRLTDMRMPYGTDLWRRQGYYGWTSSSKPYYGGGNGRLYYIFVGTSSGAANKLNLNYAYDSFGNIRQHHDNHGYHSFGYDEQNRLTSAYGQSYGYDSAGRLTSYEGAGYAAYAGHAILKSGYSYAPRGSPNGNLISRAGRTLAWNHENQLHSVSGGGLPTESYLYDDSGQRIKKTTGSTTTYYPFAHYEQTGSTVTKYYFFNGQRVAMKRGSTVSYLHSDHLSSTVLETNTAGHVSADQRYRAYGRQRDNGPVVTDHRFTGQKYDGTGLYYYNARYYDPALGAFISPDTIVPDPTNLLDYNRYMYVRGRPLTMNDPSGHQGVGQVAFDPYNGGGMGGWGPVAGMAGSVAGGYAALQLGANAADAVSANVVVPPPFRESVTLTSPTIEIAPFPTAGDEGGVPGDAPTIGLSAVYQQTVGFGNTVLADPLPTVEMGSNVTNDDFNWKGENSIVVGKKSSGRLAGYTESTSDLTGGMSTAGELFQKLTGRVLQSGDLQSLAPTDIYIDPKNLEVRFRPTSSSGTPVMEIVDHAFKTFEKIHINE